MNFHDIVWFLKVKVIYTCMILAIALLIAGVGGVVYAIVEFSSENCVGEEFLRTILVTLLSVTMATAGYVCLLISKVSYNRWFKKP